MKTWMRGCLGSLLLAGLAWGDDARPWTASWIATPPLPPDEAAAIRGPAATAHKQQPQSPDANGWFCFRKTLVLSEAPAKATARIACDSKYWLWINGDLVVFEGQLKRGPTPHDTYVDPVDLSGRLRAGSNTVAVLVWYFGKEGFSHKDSGRAGLLFELDAGPAKLVSDATWRARRHPAFGNTEAPHPNYRLPESNIRFDARRDMTGWTSPGYDDASWAAAVEAGRPPCAPWNRLVTRPTPLWRDSGLRDYVNAAAFPAVSTGGVIEARLPYNCHATPFLDIEAPAGLAIDIRTDHDVVGNVPCLRAEYVTREGRQSHESPGWLNGHVVRYAIPAGVRIHALKFRETGYDTDFAGAFSCDDEMLNVLWTKAQRTLYVTMRDTYMDCPDRERGQWWGDAVNELGETFYALCPKSHALTRKGILELMNWQRADGTIFSPVPAGNYDAELPPQMLASVGWNGFWTYYRYTGDETTIREVYPRVRRYLDVWQFDTNGLTVPRKGGWAWADWGTEIDYAGLTSAWHYDALRAQRAMAELCGATADLPGIDAKLASLKEAFNTHCWNGREYRSPSHKGATDDRLNGMAVVEGLADAAKFPAIREILGREFHASPYMEKYVLEALYLMDLPDDAIARMHRRYRDWVDNPRSTLPENFIVGGGSINHGWSGGPLTLLSQYGAGIAPTAPGFAQFAVRPQMGPLKRIEAKVATVRGDIRVTLADESAAWKAGVTVPPGTVAHMTVPPRGGKAPATVTVNGKPATLPPGGLELQPGAWRVEAVYTH